jgi:hypothetical protein
VIKDIVYFSDFGLWTKVQIEAQKRQIKVSDYIIEKCFENLDEERCKKCKRTMDFWILCSEAAQEHGSTVSAFIEESCRHAIENGNAPVSGKKSFWDHFDLNYGQKKK